MDIAKITSNGQVTIPIEIRRHLKLEKGSKVLFAEAHGRVYMMNASLNDLEQIFPAEEAADQQPAKRQK